MKRFFGYFFSIIVASALGAFLMYYYLNNYSQEKPETITKIEKSVTVTDKGISDGIDNIYDAVVVVENYKNKKLVGIGSGFFYDENGYIMTNQHVIEGSTDIKVINSNGETVSVSLVGSDEYADIAVLKIDKKYIKSIAKIGSSEETKVGDTVFTIGSPMNSSYSGTVTRGILSGKNRMVEVSVNSSSNDWIMNVMQTDAAINPGNSGGPLCNVSGEVIGINSMKIVQSEIEGIGFAIPIEDALEYANNIVKGIKVKKSYLGINMGDVATTYYNLIKYGITIDSSITSGVIVLKVNDSSPALKYGIEKGDVIIQIDNDKVDSVAKLRYFLYKHKPNEEVSIKLIRGVEEKTINVVLGEGK